MGDRETGPGSRGSQRERDQCSEDRGVGDT